MAEQSRREQQVSDAVESCHKCTSCAVVLKSDGGLEHIGEHTHWGLFVTATNCNLVQRASEEGSSFVHASELS